MDLKNSLINLYPLVRQITRFGIVGVFAASVHFSIVVFLVEAGKMDPLVANIAAFFVSFQASYWGHRRWTFRGTSKPHREALPRLLVVSISNMIANEGLFYLFLSMGLPYPVALFFVLTILPPVTFILGKLWVFR